jgi:hypothetical protein
MRGGRDESARHRGAAAEEGEVVTCGTSDRTPIERQHRGGRLRGHHRGRRVRLVVPKSEGRQMSALSTRTKARVGVKTAKHAAQHPNLMLRGARGARPVIRGAVKIRTRQARHQAAAALDAGRSVGQTSLRPASRWRRHGYRGSGQPLGSPWESAWESPSERPRCTSWTRQTATSADALSSGWAHRRAAPAINTTSPTPTTRPGGQHIRRPDICPPSSVNPRPESARN